MGCWFSFPLLRFAIDMFNNWVFSMSISIVRSFYHITVQCGAGALEWFNSSDPQQLQTIDLPFTVLSSTAPPPPVPPGRDHGI